MFRACALALGLLAAASPAAAQLPPPPPPPVAPARDAARADDVKGTAVIRGRVVTADGGRPLRRARVRVTGDGISARTASTNTAGRYEIRDLPAGRYTVHVTRGGYLALEYGQRRPGERGKPIELADGQAAGSIDFALPRMSIISGRVIDELGEPLPGASVYALQMRYFNGTRQLVPMGGLGVRTDDGGQYRVLGLAPGEYHLMATTRETWPADDDPEVLLGYLPTYYAGTPNPAEAQRVRVELGQETTAIDIQLVPGRTGSVSGVAVSSSGAPLAGMPIMLAHEVRGPGMMSMMSVGGTKTAGDGSFRIQHVVPGEYRLSVRAGGPDQPEQGDMMVQVSGGDVEGLTLVAGTGGAVRGVVVTEDGTPLEPPLDRLTVRARTVGPVSASQFRAPSGAQNGRVDQDGRFEFEAPAGPMLLNVSPLSAGWVLKAIEHDGRDVTDAPLDIRHSETIGGVRIVLTNRPSVVRGVVRDARTQEPADGTVVVFAADSRRWLEGSRMVSHARPDQHGSFEVRGLPPGDYFAIALDYVQDGQWYDPEFLDGLKLRSERFTLAEGEVRQMDLIVQQ